MPPVVEGVVLFGNGLLLPMSGVVGDTIIATEVLFAGDLERPVMSGGVGARPVEGRGGSSLATGAVVRGLRNIACE